MYRTTVISGARAIHADSPIWHASLASVSYRFDWSWSEAEQHFKRAIELEPFSLTINSIVGRRLYYAQQYEQALAVHRQTIEMDRNFVRGHVELGNTLAQMGRTEEAVAEFRQALALDEGSITALAGLGHAYAASGQRKQALQLVGQLNELAKRRYVSPYHLAVIYAGLGEREQALDQLEKAADERYNWLVFLKVAPLFEALRSEPRFNALVRRVGLPL
jgi:tetratricopeptide (TPR) repeat protein